MTEQAPFASMFTGGQPHELRLPPAPPWRPGPMSRVQADHDRGAAFQASDRAISMVNAALTLRRPLLVTGKPGTGKSSLIYAVARELSLGAVLRWPIGSRSTLQHGLYAYDAIGRLQEAQLTHSVPDLGRFVRLGPLGTALLPANRPRAVLIDEIDKDDIDLPNDLLNVFEEGEFEIPELSRAPDEVVRVRGHDSDELYEIRHGRVRCTEYPFLILTSNGERDFSPAFLRRCLQLHMDEPGPELLSRIVRAHLGDEFARQAEGLLEEFIQQRKRKLLSTDQLLNTVFMMLVNGAGDPDPRPLMDDLLRALIAQVDDT